MPLSAWAKRALMSSLEADEQPDISSVSMEEEEAPPSEAQQPRLTSLHELRGSIEQESDDSASDDECEEETQENQTADEAGEEIDAEAEPCEAERLLPSLSFPHDPSISPHAATSSSNINDDWLISNSRHFFILSSSGKPVYSYLRGKRGQDDSKAASSSNRAQADDEAERDDEDDGLSSLMALIMALVSVVKSQGDQLNHLTSGDTLVVFSVRGPLIFVATSRGQEATVLGLTRQIDLVHNQLILVVSMGLEKILLRNPSYDARPLLSGVDQVLSNLLLTLREDPTYLLQSFQPFPLPAPDRSLARQCLRESTRANPLAYYTLLITGRHIIAMERGQGQPMIDPMDLWCLSNFIFTNWAGQGAEGETFCPVCLRSFNPESFLHAHISFLDSCGIYLVSLAGNASEEAFKQLSGIKAHVERQLKGQGLIQRVSAAISRGWGRQQDGKDVSSRLQDESRAGPAAYVSIESLPVIGGRLGSSPLIHFMCRFPGSRQMVSSQPCELFASSSGRRELASAYVRLWTMVYDVLDPTRPNKIAWMSTEKWSMLALLDAEIDVFLMLDPRLANATSAMNVASVLKSYLMSKRADLLL